MQERGEDRKGNNEGIQERGEVRAEIILCSLQPSLRLNLMIGYLLKKVKKLKENISINSPQPFSQRIQMF